jgi:hypothetical protein
MLIDEAAVIVDQTLPGPLEAAEEPTSRLMIEAGTTIGPKPRLSRRPKPKVE